MTYVQVFCNLCGEIIEHVIVRRDESDWYTEFYHSICAMIDDIEWSDAY